jgi:hypothetical protein
MHNFLFAGNEWFSNGNTTSASVTYNFGAAKSFDRLALWNEDSNGIGALTLLTSNDGVNFANLATGLSPTNNVINANYGADVFSFGAVTAQYVRLDMSACPQPLGDGFNGCAIGEVAFRQVSAVPEPETNALLLAGLGLLGFVARRRTKQAA